MPSIISATTTNGVAVQGDNSGSLQLQTNNGTTAVTIDTSQRAAFVAGTAALPAITTSGDTNTGMFFPAADTIAFAEGGTETMRLDSSGNVGIGTSSPSFTSGGGLMIQNGTQANLRLDRFGEGGFELQSLASTLRFYSTAASAERMRITSGGDLFINTTTFNSAFKGFRMFSEAQGNFGAMSATGTGGYDFWNFYRGTDGSMTRIGFISTTGSGTSYSTTSDYRLKENIAPMTGALATVAQLKPVTYTWKTDGSAGQGFIAHELQAVVPDAVTGEKDAVNEDGSIKPQGVDTSFLVATLTAAIQELKAELDATKAEVQALKEGKQ